MRKEGKNDSVCEEERRKSTGGNSTSLFLTLFEFFSLSSKLPEFLSTGESEEEVRSGKEEKEVRSGFKCE